MGLGLEIDNPDLDDFAEVVKERLELQGVGNFSATKCVGQFVHADGLTIELQFEDVAAGPSDPDIFRVMIKTGRR